MVLELCDDRRTGDKNPRMKACGMCHATKNVVEFARCTASKDGLAARCRECAKVVAKEWRTENRERAKQLRKTKFNKDPEAANALRRIWCAKKSMELNERKRNLYATNPERMKRNNRAWVASHREEVRARHATYYSLNREKRVATHNIYVVTHPAVIKALHHRRRARKLAASGKWTAADLKILRGILGGRCLKPGCQTPDDRVAIDHVIPLARGGSNNPTNLQFLCVSCNSRKGTRRTDYRTKIQIAKITAAFQLQLFEAA